MRTRLSSETTVTAGSDYFQVLFESLLCLILIAVQPEQRPGQPASLYGQFPELFFQGVSI
jgi:hypothetical protein